MSNEKRNEPLEPREFATGETDDGLVSEGGIDQARRRFARLGAASPVLMTLASRPALATSNGSGNMSGDMYGTNNDPP